MNVISEISEIDDDETLYEKYLIEYKPEENINFFFTPYNLIGPTRLITLISNERKILLLGDFHTNEFKCSNNYSTNIPVALWLSDLFFHHSSQEFYFLCEDSNLDQEDFGSYENFLLSVRKVFHKHRDSFPNLFYDAFDIRQEEKIRRVTDFGKYYNLRRWAKDLDPDISLTILVEKLELLFPLEPIDISQLEKETGITLELFVLEKTNKRVYDLLTQFFNTQMQKYNTYPLTLNKLNNILVLFVDLYAMARLYNNPTKNVVIYAGNAHLRNYLIFLKSVKEYILINKIESNDPNINYQCIDMQNYINIFDKTFDTYNVDLSEIPNDVNIGFDFSIKNEK